MKAFISIPLRILTHNIRYATKTPEPGEELWHVRAPKLIGELKYHMRHVPTGIICMQEVLHDQLEDIMTGLNINRVSTLAPDVVKVVERVDQSRQKQQELTIKPVERQAERLNFLQSQHHKMKPLQSASAPDMNPAVLRWDFVGRGRDDGVTAGEYSPILFQPSTWALVEQETIWLSKTPTIPGKGWDAASPRVLTVVVLKHREAQRNIIVMNTHFDDQGFVARNESAHLILGTIHRYQKSHGATPLVLAGDLNSETNEDAYKIITGVRSRLYDIRAIVPVEDQYGDNNTFTGFGHDKPQRIDFTFVTDSPHWRIQGYGVATNKFDDGVYISDHRAVIADLEIIDPLR